MKIAPGTLQPQPAVEKTEQKSPAAAGALPRQTAQPATLPKGDRVDLSAPLTSGLRTPQEQAQRVESIKARLKAGTYQVSSREVAEKMLSGSSEFSDS